MAVSRCIRKLGSETATYGILSILTPLMGLILLPPWALASFLVLALVCLALALLSLCLGIVRPEHMHRPRAYRGQCCKRRLS